MSQLTANDLKVKGIVAIEAALADYPEAMVSVRGTDRFVVMGIEHYNYLHECELEVALLQARADVAAGRVNRCSPQEHLDGILSATTQP